MNFLNKFFVIILIFLLIPAPVFAVLDIDMTVDSDIRKKYNPKKIEDDLLPQLPEKLKNDKPLSTNEEFIKNNIKPQTSKSNINSTNPTVNSTKTVQSKQTNNSLKEIPQPKSYGQSITLKKGTTFTVRSCEKIHDGMIAGRKVYFKLSKPIKTNNFYMPANTKFIGVIVDAHIPQFTGNGGLIVLKVDRVLINGKYQDIDAKIIKYNHKKVFFNNIKGKRTYIHNVSEKIKPGKRYFGKMMTQTKKFSKNKATWILTPITFACGVVGYTVNFVGSPIFAIFSYGKAISIPAESLFEIKLLEDTTLYN